MISNSTVTNALNSPVRQITAKVELYNGSALVATYKHSDYLVSFEIDRVGASKFFGFGICQKINIKLLDIDRRINVTTANSFKVYFGDLKVFPIFYVTEVHRDENTNELSITAYDGLYKATKHTISEIEISTPYTIHDLATKIAQFLGLGNLVVNPNPTAFDASYENGGNFDGTETLRDVLDDIAEASQSIYFATYEDKLFLKRLNKDVNAVYTITKDRYFTLDSKTNRRLSTIIHGTELGDNVSATTGETGTTQCVRNNAFWDLRDDIDVLLENAIDWIGGLTINQFECEWRGNYLIELGDKIDLTTKDGSTVTSYLLDDVIFYDGSLTQSTRWSYDDGEDDASGYPTNLGEALKLTYARVDKINKKIDLVTSDVQANSESIAAIRLDTESITASVSKMEKNTTEAIEGVNGEIATLTQKVDATMTAEDVRLEIKSELDNGVTKVETNTGFTFNDEGLTVEKTNSEMKTTITEDGMTVYKNDEAVLVANNVGVNAKNLHATTYLIVGNNSRFEDYGDRTGCFWIGG